MKIREALVSNSSSSSYFFNVLKLKLNEFVDRMISEYAYTYFNRSLVQKEIEKCLATAEENQNVRIKDNVGGYKFFDKFYKESIIHYKKDLADLKKCSTNKKLVEYVLKYKGIKTDITKDGIEFSSFTAMHNDFNEGMVDLMKEIVMCYSFDTNYKTEFRREDDNNDNPKNTRTITEEDVKMAKENLLKEMNK